MTPTTSLKLLPVENCSASTSLSCLLSFFGTSNCMKISSCSRLRSANHRARDPSPARTAPRKRAMPRMFRKFIKRDTRRYSVSVSYHYTTNVAPEHAFSRDRTFRSSPRPTHAFHLSPQPSDHSPRSIALSLGQERPAQSEGMAHALSLAHG